MEVLAVVGVDVLDVQVQPAPGHALQHAHQVARAVLVGHALHEARIPRDKPQDSGFLGSAAVAGDGQGTDVLVEALGELQLQDAVRPTFQFYATLDPELRVLHAEAALALVAHDEVMPLAHVDHVAIADVHELRGVREHRAIGAHTHRGFEAFDKCTDGFGHVVPPGSVLQYMRIFTRSVKPLRLPCGRAAAVAGQMNKNDYFV